MNCTDLNPKAKQDDDDDTSSSDDTPKTTAAAAAAAEEESDAEDFPVKITAGRAFAAVGITDAGKFVLRKPAAGRAGPASTTSVEGSWASASATLEGGGKAPAMQAIGVGGPANNVIWGVDAKTGSAWYVLSLRGANSSSLFLSLSARLSAVFYFRQFVFSLPLSLSLFFLPL